jgi:hypothetical protein
MRVGREIDSAALIADGYHARVDGLTSLAVVLGAFGVWLGFPLADPIVGLIITTMILGIVWQSGKAVFTRMLDGTEPEVIHEIEHAAGIRRVEDIRARWLGHRLTVELDVAVDPDASLAEADEIAMRSRKNSLVISRRSTSRLSGSGRVAPARRLRRNLSRPRRQGSIATSTPTPRVTATTTAMGAFLGCEAVEQLADAFPSGFDGSFIGLFEERFELGENLLNRIEVRRVGRQEEQLGSGGADG